MNRKLIALMCGISASACGGSDTRPVQDPASASPMAPSDPSAVAQSPTASNNSSAQTATGRVQTSPGPDVARTAGGGDRSASAANRQPDPTANVAPPGDAAGVVNHPGSADQTKNADNTKINARDSHGAFTPMDQGNSGSDTNITAAIRKGIMGDKTLSFTAKNVKIITVGNKVTLRGPVKSDQEKATIEAIARQTAGISEVDDQLE